MANKIVIVDDEELILKSLVREFKPFCDSMEITMFTFVSANDAMTFLSKNNQEVFLVISDLRMPEIKGSIFLQNIYKLYPHIILVLLTAYSDIKDIQEAVKASIYRLLIKPWDFEELKSCITYTYEFSKLEEENRSLKQELEHNIEVAGEFQKKLLNGNKFSNSSLTIDMKYIPVPRIKCGGDFYDFFSINDDLNLILLGDVSGHGIKPAFVTSMLKVLTSLIRPKLYNSDIKLGEILTQINDGLFKSLENIKDIITTFTAVMIDTKNKTLKLSGAGQLPVYILRNGSLICLQMDSPAMGLLHYYEYVEIEEKLESDDLIILFTDGLIESEKSKTIIEEKRIQSLLANLELGYNPSEKLIEYFQKLQPDNAFADDITIITARIL